MKRGRKPGGKFINGKYVHKKKANYTYTIPKGYQVNKDSFATTTDLLLRAIRQERIKLIDQIRNVILPELEKGL